MRRSVRGAERIGGGEFSAAAFALDGMKYSEIESRGAVAIRTARRHSSSSYARASAALAAFCASMRSFCSSQVRITKSSFSPIRRRSAFRAFLRATTDCACPPSFGSLTIVAMTASETRKSKRGSQLYDEISAKATRDLVIDEVQEGIGSFPAIIPLIDRPAIGITNVACALLAQRYRY